MNDIVKHAGVGRPQREETDGPKTPQPGEYWRYGGRKDGASEDDRLPVGRVLLVERVHAPDGILHSVEMAPHPTESWKRSRLIDDFMEHFEFAPDGADVRRSEVVEVEGRIAELQRQLAAPPEMPKQALLSSGSGTVDAKLTDLIVQGVSVEQLQQQTRLMSQTLETHAQSIKAITTSMGQETTLLASFYSERAKASLAEVAETIAYAGHLEKGVATLGLYAGEDVTVETLVEGETMPDTMEGRIRIHQRQLYMDEELLIRLEENGADYTNDAEFAQMLRDDPVLLDRIIPGERSIVLMRYRRHEKPVRKNYDETDLQALMRSVAEDQANRQSFLLIRNGKQIQAVYADRALFGLERLFPRAKDISDVYKDGHSWRGIESREITVADLDYPKHREKFEALALAYRRVLVTLWGLDNRLETFGRFYDRRRHQTMLSMEFQEQHLDFIGDDESVLTELRPAFSEWLAERNKLMQPGSRVAVAWTKAMTYLSSPGAVKEERDRDGRTRNVFKYTPTSSTGMAVVKKAQERLVVHVECKYDGWSEVKKPLRNFEVDLALARSDGSRFSHLCLDGVTSEDLDWYIHSRDERAGYMDYIQLFISARRIVAREEAAQKRMVDHMTELLINIGQDAASARLSIDKAIRDWRAIKGGIELPDMDAPNAPGAIRDIVRYALLAMRGDPKAEQAIETIRAHAAVHGRRILSIEADTEGRYDVAFEHSAEERPKVLGDRWCLVGRADQQGRITKLEHRLRIPERVGRIQLVQEKSAPVEGRTFKGADYQKTMAIEAYMSGSRPVAGIEMLRNGDATAAAQYVIEASSSRDYDTRRSLWSKLYVPLVMIDERLKDSRYDRTETAPLRIHGFEFSPVQIVGMLAPEVREEIIANLKRRGSDTEYWKEYLDGVDRNSIFSENRTSVANFFGKDGEIDDAEVVSNYEKKVTDQRIFDDRESYLRHVDKTRQLSNYHKDKSTLDMVCWHPDADLMMAVVRTITQTKTA